MLLACPRDFPPVLPSVLMHQRGSHWTKLREILYCGFL